MKQKLALWIIYLFLGLFESSDAANEPWNPYIGTTKSIRVRPYALNEDVNIWYKVHVDERTWFEAMNKCLQENATLAYPTNDKEATVLYDMLNELFDLTSEKNWTQIHSGFHHLFHLHEFLTLSGSPLDISYFSWKLTTEDYMRKNRCGLFNNKKIMTTQNCYDNLRYICQRKHPDFLMIKESDIEHHDNTEYLFNEGKLKRYRLYKTPRTWTDAIAICKASGSNLATISNKLEYDVIRKMINLPKDIFEYKSQKYSKAKRHERFAFVGYHNYYGDRTLWEINGKEKTESEWLKVEPVSTQYKNCGAFSEKTGIRLMYCQEQYIHICEKEYLMTDIKMEEIIDDIGFI